VPDALTERLRVTVRGAVQGVGFRPFVFRLATELGLAGWVKNSAQGVFIEVEGPRVRLEQFLVRLERDRPPRSSIQSLEPMWLDPVGYRGFRIEPSAHFGPKTALVLPDIATCAACVRELFDPANRRYRYPFTNCTHCGPRFTIIEALPYDRPNTSMKRFVMCPQCQAEYDDPADRRFHAQPNACPACGPQLELWDSTGRVLARQDAALRQAVEAIRAGGIVAVKGLGGFHLAVAADDEPAVRRLRQLKHREEKPFALMFPDLDTVRAACAVSELEARLLRSAEAPIVLVRRLAKPAVAVAAAVAPSNPFLGVMLPYTPLHHLLLAELRKPIVATSGNRTDEPICTDEHHALSRLGGMADLFLVHNRPIVRHVDDSIVRVVLGRELVLRRARGYAPLPLPLKGGEAPFENRTVLAVGAHLKNTVAVGWRGQVFVSQHIGDLETVEAWEAFQRVAADLQNLHETRATVLASDLHPDYLSTRFARQSGLPVVSVQHHYAHVLACMVENELQPPVLGVSWDGTGYGLDGTVWGGEFLRITANGFERVAHLRPFRLPGGDHAVREPRRSAVGLLYAAFGPAAFKLGHLPTLQACLAGELETWARLLSRPFNAPLTSSVGRLFDAVASLIGLRQYNRFEGQAAMELEFAADGYEQVQPYPFELLVGQAPTPEPARLDWGPMVQVVCDEVAAGVQVGHVAARFHATLVEMIVAVSRWAGLSRVVLSGGCFQNQRLTEQAVRRLQQEGFKVYWHQRIPPNDGGIAVGQVAAAWRTAPVDQAHPG
jgi:hydrogenase maturation protein HypF